jgi:hypothetical protein
VIRNLISLDRFGVSLGILTLGVFAPNFFGAAIAQAAPPSVSVVVTPSLTGVRNDSSLAQEQGIDSNRKLGWGGGLLFDSPLGEGLSLGLGALYIERKFQIGTGSVRLERKVPTLFVPLEAKFWFMNVFTVGAGVFGAVKVGNVTDTTVVGSGGLQSTSASDHETVEYGLTASADFLLPIAERTGLIFGARYLRGLKNGSKSALYDEKIDDLAFQAGLNFTL